MADAADNEAIRLASFPEQNPDPVIEADLEGRVTYLNPMARTRFPDLEKLGSFHPLLRDLQSIIETLEQGGDVSVLRELEVGDFVYDQKTTWIPNSRLVRMYLHDITQRKLAEEAVRESEARFHNIFEYSNDAIFLLDLSTDEILDVNSKACRMLAYEREELLSKPVSAIHPDEMPNLREFALSVMSEGQGWTDELTCLTKNGQALAAEISASRVVIEGRTCLVAVARDIRDMTERARVEQVLADEVRSKYNYEEIVGESTSLQDVLKQVELVAPTDASALILGETGTGKELICRAIHHASPRSREPLVKLNCAAIPSGLIESELFGHEKGAFTGALAQKRGRFELAHEGTLFLDEVGDLPLETQPKLLRLLQEQEFERVGGNQTIKVNVRVIAATHRNLEEMVQDSRFRDDLFYRLNVFPIQLPPLRDRTEDIPPLATFFAHRACARLGRPPCRFTDSALLRLTSYSWPGNVRELENIVERAVILCGSGRIDRVHVQVEDALPPGSAERILPLREMEREHILTALRATGGKVSGKGGAAELLEMKPTTLEARMKNSRSTRSIWPLSTPVQSSRNMGRSQNSVRLAGSSRLNPRSTLQVQTVSKQPIIGTVPGPLTLGTHLVMMLSKSTWRCCDARLTCPGDVDCSFRRLPDVETAKLP